MWPVADGDEIPVARLHRFLDLPDTLRALGLDHPRPVLVVAGSAGALSEPDFAQLAPIFEEGIVPLVVAHGAAVVDGGTDAGVMRLMGLARAGMAGAFPLVGVAPAGKVPAPGHPAPHGATALAPHHSHIILVPAASWADGSPWLATVATALAGGQPTATVLFGGGDVTWIDAAASVAGGRPLVAVRGTGGVADALAVALEGAEDDPRAGAIVATGLLRVVDGRGGPAAVATAVSQALARSPAASAARPESAGR